MKIKILLLSMATLAVGCSSLDTVPTPPAPVVDDMTLSLAVSLPTTATKIDNTSALFEKDITMIRGADGVDTKNRFSMSHPFRIGFTAVIGSSDGIVAAYDYTPTRNGPFSIPAYDPYFVAIYPAISQVDANSSNTYYLPNYDGSADVMVTEPATTNKNSISLTFKHALAQVQILVKAKDAAAITALGRLTKVGNMTYGAALQISLSDGGVFTVDTLDTGDLPVLRQETLKTPITLTTTTAQTVPYEYYVLPGQTPGTLYLTFENIMIPVPLGSLDYLCGAGERLKLTVTINKFAKVSATSTIDKWSNGNNGSAIIK